MELYDRLFNEHVGGRSGCFLPPARCPWANEGEVESGAPPTNLPPPGQAGQCLGNMGCRLRRGKRRGRQEGAVLMGTASLAPRMWPYSVATARGSCTAGAEPGFLEELE